MTKQNVKAKIPTEALKFLTTWHPYGPGGISNAKATAFAVTWAAGALRRGLISARNKLTLFEMDAVVAAIAEWDVGASPLVTEEMLAHEVENYFEIGEGEYLNWSVEQKKTLLNKLRRLSLCETMGLISWSKAGIELLKNGELFKNPLDM